jgi:hypothetical protein
LKLTDRVYERLTPLERLRAIISAKARGDKTERDRLIDTCERKAYRTLDWDLRGRADHLHLMALAHYGDVHKLAFGAMKLLACLVTQEFSLSDEEELTQEQQRAWEIHDDASQKLCFIASTVEGYERAFARLCASLGFDVAEVRASHGITRVHITTLSGEAPDSEAEVIELDSARVAEAESERYELYREIWCKEFRDIREDCAPIATPCLEAVPLAGS